MFGVCWRQHLLVNSSGPHYSSPVERTVRLLIEFPHTIIIVQKDRSFLNFHVSHDNTLQETGSAYQP